MPTSTKRGRPPKSPDAIFFTSKERFWRGIEGEANPDHCWPYTGHKLRLPGGKMIGARRFSYILKTGDNPHGFDVQRACPMSNCVNWDHVRLVANGDPQLMERITDPFTPGPEPLPSDDELGLMTEWRDLHWKEREKMLLVHNKLYKDDQRDLNIHITDMERMYA